MSVVEILMGARELIADESKWTTEALARDKDGAAVSPLDKEACCWCVEGAARAQGGAGGDTLGAVLALSRVAAEAHPNSSTHSPAHVIVNDFLGHASTLRVLDLAIERARAQGEQK